MATWGATVLNHLAPIVIQAARTNRLYDSGESVSIAWRDSNRGNGVVGTCGPRNWRSVQAPLIAGSVRGGNAQKDVAAGADVLAGGLSYDDGTTESDCSRNKNGGFVRTGCSNGVGAG